MLQRVKTYLSFKRLQGGNEPKEVILTLQAWITHIERIIHTI